MSAIYVAKSNGNQSGGELIVCPLTASAVPTCHAMRASESASSVKSEAVVYPRGKPMLSLGSIAVLICCFSFRRSADRINC